MRGGRRVASFFFFYVTSKLCPHYILVGYAVDSLEWRPRDFLLSRAAFFRFPLRSKARGREVVFSVLGVRTSGPMDIASVYLHVIRNVVDGVRVRLVVPLPRARASISRNPR